MLAMLLSVMSLILQIQNIWLSSSAEQQRMFPEVQHWQQEIAELQQTQRNWQSLMVNSYNELQECKSKLEEAESSLRNMTGARSLLASEDMTVTFKEAINGRSCASIWGGNEFVEVYGSDGSRMIWSCGGKKNRWVY